MLIVYIQRIPKTFCAFRIIEHAFLQGGLYLSWKEIDHTADAGIEVMSDSLEELFSEAAEAFYFIMFDSSTFAGNVQKDHTVVLEGMDLADLAVQWLNELIYIWDTERSIFTPSMIKVDTDDLRLTVKGSLLKNDHSAGKVKAATYGGLVLKTQPFFFLRVFLDI